MNNPTYKTSTRLVMTNEDTYEIVGLSEQTVLRTSNVIHAPLLSVIPQTFYSQRTQNTRRKQCKPAPACKRAAITSSQLQTQAGETRPTFKTPENSCPPAVSSPVRKCFRGALVQEINKKNEETYITVSGYQMASFLDLLDKPIIEKFLRYDQCLRVSDRYLLAMVFAYFARLALPITEYNPFNFFVALYLAHDMEEDEEDYKYEIFPWALGRLWRQRHKTLLNKRDELWSMMNYRAVVSRKCCEEIMQIEPTHAAWRRERKDYHAGAIRPWNRDKSDNFKIIGPYNTPRKCLMCAPESMSKLTYTPESDQYMFKLNTTESTDGDTFTPVNMTRESSIPVFSGTSNITSNQSDAQLTRSGTFVSAESSLAKDEISLNWVDCPSDPLDHLFNNEQ